MHCPRCNVEISLTPGALTRCIYDNIKCGLIMDREPLLVEREKTHGPFKVGAEIFDRYMNAAFLTHLHPRQRLAVIMIYAKLSRIMCNTTDTSCKDHYIDIAGYAKLGAEACDG